MIDPNTALLQVIEAALERPPRAQPLDRALGLRLAQSVESDRDYPPFDRSTMDGYAVCVADAGRTICVAGELAAGDVNAEPIAPGQCVEIMTGAACPPATEAVVPREEVARDGDRVTLPGGLRHGKFIAPQGSDCRHGQTVLVAGDRVTPLALAAMASFGMASVRVVPRPTVSIITTGNELVPADSQPSPAQIRNSNGPMLASLVVQMGVTAFDQCHVRDDRDAIADAIRAATDRDIVVLAGGVSMGNYDLVSSAMTECGAEILLHKVAQRPGKPMLLARRADQLLFGLPGNPLSCHFCFHRYVSAAIRKMAGEPTTERIEWGHLVEPFRPDPKRPFFVTCRAEPSTGAPSPWQLRPRSASSSADVFSPAVANCYVEVPSGSEVIPAGTNLAISWFAGREATG